MRESAEEDGLVRSYRDLWVWKEGMDLAEMCYEATKAFPREEVYGMTSLASAGGDGPSQSSGGPREGEFGIIQFLRIAQGSLKELETHLILASRVKLTTEGEIAPVLNQRETLGRTLRALIRSVQKRQGEKCGE